MTVAAAPLLPPARALAAWWRQLAPLRPRRLWFADWLIHRLEFLAAVASSATLDSFERRLLESLAESSLDPSRFGLDGALVARGLAGLAAHGLVRCDSRWMPTDAGRAALETGAYHRIAHERRTACVAADPLLVLPLRTHGAPLALLDPPPAPLHELRAAIDRPLDWKRAAGFPEEIAAVIHLDAPLPDVHAWRRVPVDRLERLLAAIVLLPNGEWQGFAVRPDSWALAPDAAFTLGPAAAPEIPEAPLEAWREAWHAWTQGLPAEVRDIQLEAGETDLTLVVDPAILTSLRAKRPDLGRGDVALLAGAGPTRAVRAIAPPK